MSTSNGCARHWSSASGPELACVIAAPVPASAFAVISRLSASSSTTRMRLPARLGRSTASDRATAALGALQAGKRQRETAALSAAAARRFQHASVQLADLFGDGETEAQAPVLACRRLIGLAKPLEDMRQKFGRNPDARIGDDDRAVAVVCAQLDAHRAAGLGEFHRVGQQIPDDLLQPIAVAGDDGRRREAASIRASRLSLPLPCARRRAPLRPPRADPSAGCGAEACP